MAIPSPIRQPVKSKIKPTATRQGMQDISPNAEQGDVQFDAMQASGKPLYQPLGFGGVNFNVNTVTGMPEGMDRKRYEYRNAADVMLNNRMAERQMSTPIGGDYSRGLGTGVAPINVLAEKIRQGQREAEFAQMRSDNRAAFDRAMAQKEAGTGVSPSTYKIGRSDAELAQRVAEGDTAGAAEAQSMLDARARLADSKAARRKARAQRGIEYGNALAAADTFRRTGVAPNQDFLMQMLAQRDPRGMMQYQSELQKNALAQKMDEQDRSLRREELGLRREDMKSRNDYNDRTLAQQLQIEQGNQKYRTTQADADKVRADSEKALNDAKLSLINQQALGGSTAIPTTPEGKIEIARRGAQYGALRGGELYDALGPIVDAIDKDPTKAKEILDAEGISPETLRAFGEYQPTLPYRPNSHPAVPFGDVAELAEYQREALPIWKLFGEGKDEFLARRRRQDRAKGLNK